MLAIIDQRPSQISDSREHEYRGPHDFKVSDHQPIVLSKPDKFTVPRTEAELMDLFIGELQPIGLKLRTVNCLETAGVMKYRDLPHSVDDLLLIRNFGPACVRELQRVLTKLRGLMLAARKPSTAKRPGPAARRPKNSIAELRAA